MFIVIYILYLNIIFAVSSNSIFKLSKWNIISLTTVISFNIYIKRTPNYTTLRKMNKLTSSLKIFLIFSKGKLTKQQRQHFPKLWRRTLAINPQTILIFHDETSHCSSQRNSSFENDSFVTNRIYKTFTSSSFPTDKNKLFSHSSN